MMKSEEIIKDFFDGTSFDSYEYLGAHVSRSKTVFRTYAPSASGVNIFGEFNSWQEEPMTRDDRGIWSFESKKAKPLDELIFDALPGRSSASKA